MPKVPLTNLTVNFLSDGLTGRAIDKALEEITADLIDRGIDGETRELVIKVAFKADSKGLVGITPRVRANLPDQRPGATLARLSPAAGGLLFNTDCADHPDQMTTNDVAAEEPTGEVRVSRPR